MNVFDVAERAANLESEETEAMLPEYVTGEKSEGALLEVYGRYRDILSPDIIKRLREAEAKRGDAGVLAGLLNKTILEKILYRDFTKLRHENEKISETEHEFEGESISLKSLEKKSVKSLIQEEKKTYFGKMGRLSDKLLKPLVFRRIEIAEQIARELGYTSAIEMAQDVFNINSYVEMVRELLRKGQGKRPNMEKFAEWQAYFSKREAYSPQNIKRVIEKYAREAFPENNYRHLELMEGKKGGAGKMLSNRKFQLISYVILPIKQETNVIHRWNTSLHELLDGFAITAKRSSRLRLYTGLFNSELDEAFAALGERILESPAWFDWFSETSGSDTADSEIFLEAAKGHRINSDLLGGGLKLLVDVELFSNSRQSSDNITQRCEELYLESIIIANPQFADVPDAGKIWSYKGITPVPFRGHFYVASRMLGGALYYYMNEKFGGWTYPSKQSRQAWSGLSRYAASIDSSKTPVELMKELGHEYTV